jgi:hypothetical protein
MATGERTRVWWGVLACTTLVLAASLLPWYGIDWAVLGSATGARTGHSWANVWQFSSVWSVAVLLSAAAGLWWLWLRAPGQPWADPSGGWVDRHAARLALLAVVVLAVPWWWLRGLGPYRTVVVTWAGTPPPDEPAIGEIPRDLLFRYHAEGFHADVRFGLSLGIVALVAQAVALRHVRRGPRDW